MFVAYITEQGAVLHKREGRLYIEKESVAIADMPLEQVERIVLFGNIHLTTPLVVHCLNFGVDVCFLSQSGDYLGRLVSHMSQDASLRLAQYQTHQDERWRLEVARSWVVGKIRNQRVFCERREPEEPFTSLGEMKVALEGYEQQVAGVDTLEELQGVEGIAAKTYFLLFPKFLRSDLVFSGTRDRPALDPINALLNLGYTLLYNDMLSAIYRVGLDPYIGSYHEIHFGHACLASDLLEEFRPVVVDALVVLMVNHHELTQEDFYSLPSGEMRLSREAFKKFLERYDRRVDTQVNYPLRDEHFSYRQIFELQVYQYARLLSGKTDKYVPYLWDW